MTVHICRQQPNVDSTVLSFNRPHPIATNFTPLRQPFCTKSNSLSASMSTCLFAYVWLCIAAAFAISHSRMSLPSNFYAAFQSFMWNKQTDFHWSAWNRTNASTVVFFFKLNLIEFDCLWEESGIWWAFAMTKKRAEEQNGGNIDDEPNFDDPEDFVDDVTEEGELCG